MRVFARVHKKETLVKFAKTPESHTRSTLEKVPGDSILLFRKSANKKQEEERWSYY